jgi:hypothetical protein
MQAAAADQVVHISTQGHQGHPAQTPVSLSGLLLVYAIIPLALGLIWVDQTFLNNTVRLDLPYIPEMWVVWVYLFGMPHVIASIHTLADREYLSFYGAKLFWIAAIFMALPIVVTKTLGANAMFMIFTAFIVYHTIAQQYGITFAALRQKPTVVHRVWKWSAVGVGMALYAMIYARPIPLSIQTDSVARTALLWLAGILLAVNVLSGAVLMHSARKNRVAIGHVVACTAMTVAEFIFFVQWYFALVVIVGRVIHEFTAWHIYATHDRNRNLQGSPNLSPNLLFRVFRFTGIPVYLLSIILAFAIGMALYYGLLQIPALTSLLVSISLIHYYMESFLWKSGSIHRRHLQFRN